MKKLSTYLFLVFFSFQISSWADDIRDFQIEGMSVGDSLLDYFSEEEIIAQIKEGKDGWRVIPRYLNKEKEIDPRYYEPHIHPEAIFWARADESLMELAKGLPGSSLDFWSDVDWVGGMVGDELITFNSVDVSLSFANKLPLGKHYTYHFKEALWNKVFALSVGDPENYFLDTWSS